MATMKDLHEAVNARDTERAVSIARDLHGWADTLCRRGLLSDSEYRERKDAVDRELFRLADLIEGEEA